MTTHVRSLSPLARFGVAEEIANVALFLATGSLLPPMKDAMILISL